MKVLAYDPYLTEDKAQQLGVKLATIDEIARQADFCNSSYAINT